jgi:hypothetical protein
MALSTDGSVAVFAKSNDTVSVVDVESNAILRTVKSDARAEWGSHALSAER